MKKIITGTIAGLLISSAVSAQSIKLVNTFGGDKDCSGGNDMFVFENQKDSDGKYTNEFNNEELVSDRLQLDASGKMFDGRIRMEISTSKLNGKDSALRLRGYGRFKPVDQIQIIAGNDMFTKVAVNAGYLTASDDYPKYARILQNGAGLISAWKIGEDVSFNVAAGVKGTKDSFIDMDKFGLDFGANFAVKDVVSVGASFQNVTGKNYSAAVFAGLNAVPNLTLNAGYIYNDTDTDFIAANTENAVSLSCGYDFKDAGLYLGADATMGIEEKNNPFFAKARVDYKVSDNFRIGVKAKVYTIFDTDNVNTEILPNVSYKLPNKFGEVNAGIRFNTDKDGLAKISVPLTWKCTLADIKK